jgi:hypothetical protein
MRRFISMKAYRPCGTDKEFHGARARITDVAGEGDGVRADPFPHGRIEIGCGRDLDHLLMAALQ